MIRRLFALLLILQGLYLLPLECYGKKEVFEKYLNHHFIETGSFLGSGIQMALDAGFPEVFSIELSEHYHQYCKNRFSSLSNVHLEQGDSSYVLPKILAQIDSPATFWLDGHYSSGDTAKGETNSPILAELAAIAKHPIKTHTIMIDDIRLFGTMEFDFIQLKDIVDAISKINPAYQFKFEDGYVPNDILVAYVEMDDAAQQNCGSAPPVFIPHCFYNDFTLNGSIPVQYWYRVDFDRNAPPQVYSKERVNYLIELAKQKQPGYYGSTDVYLYEAIEKYISFVKEKSVAIIGSTTPWYESIALAHGALPTTIEYQKINCTDPRIVTLTVKEYEENPEQFDAVFSISSFEHDGLGRYGDPISPDADFKAMNKVKSMLKPGGLLFLAVPVGQDKLVWNVHRIYGSIRLKKLLEGWRIIDYFGFTSQDLYQDRGSGHQPVFVLTPEI